MKLISFEPHGSDELHFGALVSGGREVLDFCAEAADVPAPPRHLDWMDLVHPSHQHARALFARVASSKPRLDELRAQGAVLPLTAVRLRAPVPRPGKFICIGLNYRDHAREQGLEPPTSPIVFSKFSTSVCAPGDPVRIPYGSPDVDYEAELGVVVGRLAQRVPAARAYEHVLGYTNVNDVSARTFQFKDGQWQRGKSHDTFGPSGPYIATTDEIPDPQRLAIRFRLNGKTMQDSSTDQLIFGVPALIEYLSHAFTLEPGDVIATGTPPGVGFARKPPVFVKPGDRMEVEIEGLSVLENPVVAA